MKKYLTKNFKKISKTTWILVIIILFGTFLRTYNFHNWLDFGSDQVKDATRVGAVVDGTTAWPDYGPDMGNSGSGGRNNRFRLGPIYYDAEILSAKIFGNNPVSMAYPDLLFTILSLPLFYYFVRRIFDINSALTMTGLFAVSFYALTFSHSAWNINSIPFFSLLFLLSLYEFIVAKEKTHWGWVITLGVALGVSVQLHAILLVLFPATVFFAGIIFMRKNLHVWKKLGVVIAIMVVLNLGQIIGDARNNFVNAKIFLASVTGSSTSSKDSWAVRTANGLSCNAQANAYMLSGVGDGNCDFSLGQIIGGQGGKGTMKMILQPMFIFKAMICLIFSLGGYWILVYYILREKELKRRYFFGLLILYSALSFLVMLPVMDAAIRYFVQIFFLPFIFLGFGINFLRQKFPQKYLISVAVIIIALVATNSRAIYYEVSDEFAQSRIILGQVEVMVDYMIAQSGSQKEIYLFSSNGTSNFFNSLKYVATQKNVSLLRAGDADKASPEKAKFYLGVGTADDLSTKIGKNNFDNYRNFNQVVILHLTN